MGFDDFIPPYAEASGDDILKGVNYASAAAGIRDETGQQLVPINYATPLFLITMVNYLVFNF